jgi:secreted trypsin-like serine protease
MGSARPGSDMPARLRGSPESFIIGGVQATVGQWPSALSLEYFSIVSGWSHICGAILFRDRYALTAATCVFQNPVSNLRLRGGVIFRDNPEATNGQLLPVAIYQLHQNFSLAVPGAPNDIAIIYLTVPADTTVDHVKNALLPPNNINEFLHCNCFAAGFGRLTEDDNAFSNTLQWVQMCGMPNIECASRIAGIDQGRIYPEHLCTLSNPPGRGPCNGDVGSAIYGNPSTTDTSVMYAVGIVSWNAGTGGRCNLNFPVVSTRISSFLDWIDIYAPAQ